MRCRFIFQHFSILLQSPRLIVYQGQEHGIFLGGVGAVSSVCPNQLHDALVSVSALHQVILSVACTAVPSLHLSHFNLIC
jgi:hypothetical protein